MVNPTKVLKIVTKKFHEEKTVEGKKQISSLFWMLAGHYLRNGYVAHSRASKVNLIKS